ncbi:hypothetical protein KKA15_05010 [Patescibacteria group bacterium]|nr:hypothetical protein [Patescibacteria group bacterium]
MKNPEMSPEQPKKWETLTTEQIIERIKSNSEAQEKAFGSVLTEEQFKERFPHNSAKVEDIQNMMLALGLELPTQEDVEQMMQQGEENDQEEK